MSCSSFIPQEGGASFETRYEDEAIWSAQRLMTELFDVDVRVISKRLRTVYSSTKLGQPSENSG